MANRDSCYGSWKAEAKLHCVLWLCLVLGGWYGVESRLGCSFSADEWCGFSNVHDGINGPRWHRQKAPAQQNSNPFHYSTRMTLYGTHPMQWPPKGDHYLYTGPSQNDQLTERNAELRSPLLQVNGTTTCLYFSYHNQVPVRLVPTLVVFKRNANLSEETRQPEVEDQVLGEFYSLNSAKWFEASIRLPVGEYNLIFSGKNYNNRTLTGGQIGLTNIAIAEGDCGTTVPEWLKGPGDCGFEDDLESCGYQYGNDSNVRLMKIVAESLSTFEQSRRDQRQPPADHFLAMTAQFHEISNQGSKARLLSPEISIQREGCLLLWYYNSVQSKQESNNAFNIFKLERSDENLLFRLPIPKSHRDRWYQFVGALPRGDYRLLLEVGYTGDYVENDYVGLDSVEVFNRSCSDVKSTANVCDLGGPPEGAVCRNGGICVNAGKKHFRCVCGNGHYGTRCEHEYGCSAGSNRCENGGTCVPDGKVDFQCQCPTGYEGKRCENIKTCESPEHVFKNARLISFTNETFGSSAQFECIGGWLGLSELTGTCNAQGTWELRGKCVWVNCPTPPNLYQVTLVSVTNTTNGGLARYRCPEGRTTRKDRDFLICKLHPNYHYNHWSNYGNVDTLPGQWLNLDNSQNIECYDIPRCERPPAFSNAEVNFTTLLMNGVATYRCIDGYYMERNNLRFSSFEINCSRSGRWIFVEETTGQLTDIMNMIHYGQSHQVFQCFKTPDCGPPPKVPNSVVKYTNTTIESKATYTCRDGYRVVGSEVAVCWKTSDNRFQQWVDWLFVPTCEYICSVKEGRRGNSSVAVFQVSSCVLTGFETVSANLICGPPVTYSARRKNVQNGQERVDERVAFYGSDLCIAERTTKIKRFRGIVVEEAVKCKSFCLHSASEIRDLVVRDELIAVPSHSLVTASNYAFGTIRNQSIIRYKILRFD